MPFEHRIDHTRHLVETEAHGTVGPDDFFGHQHDVWSRTDVAGYDELIDMTNVTEIREASTENIQRLAELVAGMDRPAFRTKLAIVAPQDEAFIPGQMFECYHSATAQNRKQIGVFRTRAEAFAFLGLPERPPA